MKISSQIFIAAAFFTTLFSACNPTQSQLAKEKERTETTVKQSIEPMQKQVEQLKNEVKIAELKSDLAISQLQLENLQTPKETKTQDQQNTEINSLTSKISDLQNQISGLQNQNASTENAVITSDSTPKK